jgi:hypothetical protein
VGQTPSKTLILGILIPFGNSEQSRLDGSGVYLTGQSRAGSIGLPSNVASSTIAIILPAIASRRAVSALMRVSSVA